MTSGEGIDQNVVLPFFPLWIDFSLVVVFLFIILLMIVLSTGAEIRVHLHTDNYRLQALIEVCMTLTNRGASA